MKRTTVPLGEFEGLENYEKARKKQRDIYFTGHFGNWVFLACRLAILYQPSYRVQAMDDPLMRECGPGEEHLGPDRSQGWAAGNDRLRQE
jgi:hypothetical protein